MYMEFLPTRHLPFAFGSSFRLISFCFFFLLGLMSIVFYLTIACLVRRERKKKLIKKFLILCRTPRQNVKSCRPTLMEVFIGYSVFSVWSFKTHMEISGNLECITEISLSFSFLTRLKQ